MYIVFLDESGQPGGYDKEKNQLVQNTSKYFTLAGFMIDADEILNIERNMRDVKIKYGLEKQHEIKWHTTYSKLGLNFEQYKSMKLEIINIIAEYKNSVIGIVMDKERCYRNKEFMIADSRQSIHSNKLDKELQIAYLRAKNMGTYFIKFPNFCESIIFVDSDDFSGVQLADFCAGAIHRKYEREDKEFFNKLLPAIVTKRNNIYGPGIKLYK